MSVIFLSLRDTERNVPPSLSFPAIANVIIHIISFNLPKNFMKTQRPGFLPCLLLHLILQVYLEWSFPPGQEREEQTEHNILVKDFCFPLRIEKLRMRNEASVHSLTRLQRV